MPKKTKQTKHLESKPLDDTDRLIANSLLNNSRLSLREIAKKTFISVATAMNRLKGWKKIGLIKGYTAYIDYEKAGFDVEVLIEVRISKGKLFEVENKIATHPNVFAVYDTTGAFDCIILARFPNRRQMDAFLKKLQTFEFVERTETKLILNTIKEKNIGI